MNVTRAMPVEDRLRHALLAIRNAGRHQNASSSDARFVYASLLFGDARINKRANEPTGCCANASANECGRQGSAEWSRYCNRPDAGYSNRADTNQKARKATQYAAAHRAGNGATCAARICVNLRYIGLSCAHRNADVIGSDATIPQVLYGSLCLRGTLEQSYYCCHIFMSS
jgi:hypothetical protein